MGQTLIVIHGVGDSPAGRTLSEVLKGLATWGKRSDLVIKGVTYPSLKEVQAGCAEVIEVNWADVARTSKQNFFRYYIQIIIGLLALGPQMPASNNWTARAYRGCFEALLAFCIYPAFATMFYISAPDWLGLVSAGVVVVAVGLLTASLSYLSHYRKTFLVGWVWTVFTLLTLVGLKLGVLSGSTAVQITSGPYILSQVLTALLLLLALLRIARSRSVDQYKKAVAAALLYLPLFMISTVGAVLWACGFAFVTKALRAPHFDAWQQTYAESLKQLGYNTALVEFTFGAVVAALAVGFIGVVVRYLILNREDSCSRPAGPFARVGTMRVLRLGAIMYVVLAIVYVLSAATKLGPNWNYSILTIYGLSALRFLPYLPFMFGPLATVVGIIVDVLFYLSDVPKIATAEILRARFKAALDHELSRGNTVVIAAHSQGSVIAADVLAIMDQKMLASVKCFITAGSPIDSLYKRFLGSTLESRTGAPAISSLLKQSSLTWINFRRTGDYIGWKQDREGVDEVCLGKGGHTGYWLLPDLWKIADQKCPPCQNESEGPPASPVLRFDPLA